MKHIFPVVVLIVAAVNVGWAQTRPVVTDQLRRFAGCYALVVQSWANPAYAASLSRSQVPPARFELDTLEFANHPLIPANVPPDSRALRVLPTTLDGGDWPATWGLDHRAGSDSVVVGWSTGFAGVMLWLTARGDSLVGRAWAFTDVVDEYPSVAAIARRIPCDTPRAPVREPPPNSGLELSNAGDFGSVRWRERILSERLQLNPGR